MRETKSECNGCGAIHISFDYKVLVSSMGPLAGNAGLFTTLEQTQTSMSINSVIIIFEWIFAAVPYPSFFPTVLNEGSQGFLNHRETAQLGWVCWTCVWKEGGKKSSVGLSRLTGLMIRKEHFKHIQSGINLRPKESHYLTTKSLLILRNGDLEMFW